MVVPRMPGTLRSLHAECQVSGDRGVLLVFLLFRHKTRKTPTKHTPCFFLILPPLLPIFPTKVVLVLQI